jgi:hypothetical protein
MQDQLHQAGSAPSCRISHKTRLQGRSHAAWSQLRSIN